MRGGASLICDCCAFFSLRLYRYMFFLFVYEVPRLGYIQKKITCLKRYNWYKHDEWYYAKLLIIGILLHACSTIPLVHSLVVTFLRDYPTIYNHIYNTHTQDSMPHFSHSVLLERIPLRCEHIWHIRHVLIFVTWGLCWHPNWSLQDVS